MWEAFNKKAAGRLSEMYGECKKKKKKTAWMGDIYWRELQDHWQTEGYKRLS